MFHGILILRIINVEVVEFPYTDILDNSEYFPL